MTWQKDAAIAVSGGLVAAIATVTTGVFGFANKNRELDIKMIEIALGILREDPEKSKITAARCWAVDLLDEYSGVQLTRLAREELLRSPLNFTYTTFSKVPFPDLPKTKPTDNVVVDEADLASDIPQC